MSKELIVSAGRHETRVAILDDDQVVELFHEREKEYSLAGSIHKGRVTRVLPGMQSAFVDIGLDRDAFLYVSDFFEDNDEYDAVVSTVEEKVLKMERAGTSAPDLNREPVRKAQDVPPPEDESAIEPIAAGAGVGALPAGAAPPRAEGNKDGRGDRGGRGRRGRRRRGGRPSGLPDSKFFSPGAEPAGPAEAETDEVESNPEPTPVVYASRNFQQAEDFMVLPGESLAKYAPGDEQGTIEDGPEPAVQTRAAGASGITEAPASEPVVSQPDEQPQVASALPGEHPLAGFGEVASWVTSPEAEETVHEIAVAEETGASLAVEDSAAPPQVQDDAETSARPELAEADSAVAVATEEEGLSAAEVAEGLVASDALAAEETFENGAELSAEDQSLENQSEENQDEGPEPARIPTSLTATLREQGHRYPHRVSRRMRRKMRGGDGQRDGQREGQRPEGQRTDGPAGEEGEKQAAGDVAAQPEMRGESRNVSGRREERNPGGARESRGGEARGGEARGGEPREAREPRESRQDGRSNDGRAEARGKDRPERERPPLPSISDLLKEGQEIIVQIAKEPLGQKGARITSHIALPGRFVVYMPTVEHVGVSRKIPSDEERQRLKRVLQTHRQGIPGGFICRTAAENKSEEELRSDMHFLYNLWLDMRQKAEKKPAPVLLHHDLDLVQRILRDQLTTSFKTIWVDHEELYTSILSFVERFQPALVGRVKLYTRSNPIFDEFGITAEVEKALRPKVWLKSGGYIVINQTEALVAIDINTGKYVGKSNRLEDTIVKINTDAIKEIVRQIRLRDLGGIIVVDFIDMDERKNRQKVMLALEDSMRADRAPYKILQFNDFGLVAITRKRVKQSLERTLCTPCSYCEGAGYIKSVPTVVSEILQEAQKMRKGLETEQSNIVLRVNPEVAKVLKSNHNSYLQEIEEIIGKSVLVKSDPLLHQTKFDLA
jgi:ribonuclease G